jgi:virginiamycin B lyase
MEFSIPTASSAPQDIVAGPDGFLWFTELTGNKVGRISTDGSQIDEFPIPAGASAPQPRGIAVGPDGNLWFVENNGNRVDRITPAGVITPFTVPTPNAALEHIVAGPDGNLWFTEAGGNKIGRITP